MSFTCHAFIIIIHSFYFHFLASFYDPDPDDLNFTWDYRGAAITIDMNEQNKKDYCISKTDYEGKLSFTNK